MKIIERETLEMQNVLSFRGKMTQQEFAAKSKEFERIMQDAGAKKAAPAVTTTFAVEQGPTGPMMDVEILIPLDKQIQAPAGYTFKPRFLLANAVMVHHTGHPSKLQESVNALNAYITEHQLVPITSGYNVTLKEAKTPLELDKMEVCVYVGVSPNLL